MKRVRLISSIVMAVLIIPSILILDTAGGDPPNPIPSTVTTELTYVNETIIQSSDIIVNEGGVLTLSGSTLSMSSTSSNTYKIEVNDGGKLIVINESEIIATTTSYRYNFNINDGGYLYVDSSSIEDVGADNYGINIESDQVWIMNSTISTEGSKAVYIDDSSPSIVDCAINNIVGDGIVVEGLSTPHIYNNQMEHNDRSIYVSNNLVNYEPYDPSGSGWVNASSKISYVDATYDYYTLSSSGECDIGLLAAGTSVSYSGASYGIWGDGGKPEHEVGAMLDGDTEDIAMTNVGDVGEKSAYFALSFNRIRSISEIEIYFDSVTNCVRSWDIWLYDGDTLPSYESGDWGTPDISEQDWENDDSWETTLSPSVSAKFLLFEATEFNGVEKPMIKKFSVFTDDDMAIFRSDKISLSDSETWDHIYIDRDTTEHTDVLVSVCHQERDNGNIIPLSGFENIPYDDIDLSMIDPIIYPTLIFRFILLDQDSTVNYPKFYGFKLYKKTSITKEIEWTNSTVANSFYNTDVSSGDLHISTTGDYYSFSFDNYNETTINGEDSWTVSGSGIVFD